MNNVLLRGGSNTNTNNNSITAIDVGTPKHATGWCETHVRYHNFVHLPHRHGVDHTDSPSFNIHGLDWYLRIHPGGAASATTDDAVSLYLRCKTASDQNVAVQAEFSLALCRPRDGSIDYLMSCPVNAFRRKRKGWPNFVTRSRLLDPTSRLLDEDGTLTVVVAVQLFIDREVDFVLPATNGVGVGLSRLLKEANPACDLFNNNNNNNNKSVGGEYDGEEVSPTKDTADVQFALVVAGKNANEGITDTEIIVNAHRLILKISAPTLAQLCEDADTPVPIFGVRPIIFRTVLDYVYGNDVPDSMWAATMTNDEETSSSSLKGVAIELCNAGNQFGIVGLKLLAETKILEHPGISISNFSDLILYADAKNCALLKERAIEYYVVNARAIRCHPSYVRVRESAMILDELMDALLSRPIRRSVSTMSSGGGGGDEDVDYDTMGVNLLRRTLNARRLDVDGSREMLIRRLVRSDDRRRG